MRFAIKFEIYTEDFFIEFRIEVDSNYRLERVHERLIRMKNVRMIRVFPF